MAIKLYARQVGLPTRLDQESWLCNPGMQVICSFQLFQRSSSQCSQWIPHQPRKFKLRSICLEKTSLKFKNHARSPSITKLTKKKWIAKLIQIDTPLLWLRSYPIRTFLTNRALSSLAWTISRCHHRRGQQEHGESSFWLTSMEFSDLLIPQLLKIH